MGRTIAAVLAGYFAMAILLFVLFTLYFLMLGSEGAYRPGTYDVSAAWIVGSIVAGFVAAVFGGWLAFVVDSASRGVRVLAVVVLLLGVASALFGGPEGQGAARTGEVGVLEAMSVSVQPLWIMWLNPLIGAVGVLVGGRLAARRRASAAA